MAHLNESMNSRMTRLCKISWPGVLILLYLVYSKISYSATVDGSHLATKFFIIVLPAFASLLTLVVIHGIEESSRVWIKPSLFIFPVIKYLGFLTYCYYMLHSAVMFSIQSAFPNFTYQHKLLISLPLIFLISALVYYGIELKFHHSVNQ